VLLVITRCCRYFTFCIVVLLAVSCASSRVPDTADFIGKPAPDFSLTTLDDRTITLSELKGNVVVLDFWATWCPSCQKSLPLLDKISQDKAQADRGLRVIAVDCGETKQAVGDYLAKNNLSLRVVRDEGGSLLNDYQIHTLPATMVIGRDGTISNIFSVPDETELNSAIAKALSSS
jgi:thiol-disulfide isomerase/thioredoxin